MTLSNLLQLETLTPLQNNVLAFFIKLLYFKIALELSLACSKSSKLCIFVVLSTSVLFSGLFDISDGWSWRLSTIIPAALMARFIIKGKSRNPEDVEVQALSRSSSPSELLWGPVQITLVLFYLGWFHFQTSQATILAASMVGDALASPIGKYFGRHIYQMPLASPKTMEGSVVGVFGGTVATTYLYLWISGLPLIPLRLSITYSAVAALVEATAPGYLDNLMIPLVLHFSMDRIALWLPA